MGVRVPPPGRWGGDRETGPWGPGAGSEVHAPGGLTSARGQQSWGGSDRNGCREGNGFFVSLLLLDFVLSLDCKKLLWQPAHPGWVCTRTRRSPGCQGPAAPLCSGESRAGRATGSRWLQVMKFSFLFFFFFFLFLFHLVEIFTTMGEEEERGRGKRAP